MTKRGKNVLFLLLVLAVMVVVAACVSSDRPVPPPAFISWCDACETYTKWGFGEDYFYCSASGTVWNPAEGVIK